MTKINNKILRLSPFYIPSIRIRARRYEKGQKLHVDRLNAAEDLLMNHTTLQLDLCDTCRRVDTANHVHDIELLWMKFC